MFRGKIIFAFVILVTFIEFSRQTEGTENNDVSDAKVKEETLAAVRRGDIKGLRSGMNKGGLKSYANIFKNYSHAKIKDIEDVMNEKMHAVERLIASKLAVPASKESPDEHLFNVTIIPETDIISQLALNLEALKKWEFYEKPLHTLCGVPEIETRIVKLLLEKGLDGNERSNLPQLDTPLELAAYGGNLALVKFLIEKGADPNSTLRVDLEEAENRNYHRFIRVFSPKDLVIRNGTKIHQNALSTAVSGGHKDVVKYLISLGTDVNVDKHSWNALFPPVLSGKTDIVEILLKNGCDVNGRDAMGATALHMAADTGNLEMVRLLLKYGANITAIDNFGWSPLHVAAFSSYNIALVELLVDAGAAIDVTTDRGFTPLILAEAGTDHTFLDCLGQAIVSSFSKEMSCQRKNKTFTHKDNLYILALLCNKGVNVNHVDDALGWSALHWAAAVGDENAARLLRDKCRASTLSRSKAGMSPGDVAKHFGWSSLNQYLG